MDIPFGDVSVVGFDNYVKDQFGKVGITTYEIDVKEMAKGRFISFIIRLEMLTTQPEYS